MQHRVSDFATLDETLFLSGFKKEIHFISFEYTLDILHYDMLVNVMLHDILILCIVLETCLSFVMIGHEN